MWSIFKWNQCISIFSNTKFRRYFTIIYIKKDSISISRFSKPSTTPLFTPKLLAKLKGLSGDIGAKAVLKAHKEQVALVDLGDGLWSRDIDDWETYVGLARALNWQDALNFISISED